MPDAAPEKVSDSRRDFVQKCGKFAILTPPTVTMLLSTSMNSSAVAASGGGGGPFGNNGVGNGYDPQPPGNPPVNDGVGTGPGNPGNRGGPNN
jgi:hypothetical protein